MKKKIPVEKLLRWRFEKARAEAPPAPSAAHLLAVARPWLGATRIHERYHGKTRSTKRTSLGMLSRMTSKSHSQDKVHRIELNLREISQLFNTMDPSPFNEKDLDHDAEEFIVSWAREFPLDEPIKLVIDLDTLAEGQELQQMIKEAVHHYFAYRVEINRLDFRHLMQNGRRSLLTGLGFLSACLALSRFVIGARTGTFSTLARESLAIAGWVAMWRPMEIYLYDWWPLRRHEKILRKLSTMEVEVRKRK